MLFRALAIILVSAGTASADYKPRTVEQAVEPDLVIAVDNHASMTYDWCGSFERNQVYGDGDRNPVFVGVGRCAAWAKGALVCSICARRCAVSLRPLRGSV